MIAGRGEKRQQRLEALGRRLEGKEQE